MSILADVYRLCKHLKHHESRDKIRALVRRLDSTALGDLARKQRAQFLGYLVADSKRDALADAGIPEPIPQLASEDIDLLTGAHAIILQVNQRCVASLEGPVKRFADAVDPYHLFKYAAPNVAVNLNLATLEAIDAVARSFAGHPAIVSVLESEMAAMSKLSVAQCVSGVAQFEFAITKDGVFRNPEGIGDLLLTKSASSPPRLFLRDIVALTCIRASLGVVDQLAYQAFLLDRLPALTEENTIDIRGPASNLVCDGIKIVYQPDRSVSLLHTGEAVLAKYTSVHPSIDKLGQVHSSRFDFSRDSGTTMEVHLRLTDDNLNPFASLLSLAIGR
jgi:hypothetical protein